jgi:hypothetical protein
MTDYKGIKTFDELTEREHGKIGTESRNSYEESAQLFIVSEMLKEDNLKEDCYDKLSLTEFNQIIDDSEEDAANGKVKGIQELDKDMDTWT